ncbi:MAG: O-antigen ligase family protein, partial [Candidatus Omnitrophica bacterium]|nr:O-antigen ligase family protein [Candidatus Omnitrophota bacterium]
LVLFLMLPYTAQERIFDLTDLKSGTTWERLMLWKGTVNMVKAHPVLGFGVNTYSRNFPAYKPPEYPDVRYTHNSYLHMASEVGVTGALLFLIFLMSVMVYSWRGISLMADSRQRDIGAGLLAGLIGFSMNCVVDTHLYSVTLAVFFHLLLGFCFALTRHAHEE